MIGAHGGAYSIYRALAVSSGTLDPNARPDLKDTGPLIEIGPHRQWVGQGTIVSLDPWGHRVAEDFGAEIEDGLDVRPTIAITKAHLMLPEVREAIELGLVAVVSTQLWHHTYIDGSLADLPSLAGQASFPDGRSAVARLLPGAADADPGSNGAGQQLIAAGR